MSKETLSEKRCRFTNMVAGLLYRAVDLGFRVSLGEAYRPPITAEAMAKSGKGIKKSLHTVGLAVDLNLYVYDEQTKKLVYLDQTEHHRRLGEYWESMGGSWGGRFGDGNHYSLEHNGVR